MTYKVGDKLKWRGVFEASMYTVGKEYEIAKEYKPGGFYITDDNVGVEDTRHTWPAEDIAEHFDRASPIRTITCREIVPGVYGGVEVQRDTINGGPLPLVKFYARANADELREAAHLFNQLADVLQENAA